MCECFTNIAPFTGFPAITIPIGQREDRIPMDSYWMARRFDEAALLGTVFEVERLLGCRLHFVEPFGLSCR
ncbi:MAG: hypothetical protein LBH43_05170 [Treponema sp.]|nr:hypothetical protein [Treponema sp.]